MTSTRNGPSFWDNLLGPSKGQYPEYVSPDIFLGEYVALLEQDNSSDSSTKALGLSVTIRRTQAQSELRFWKCTIASKHQRGFIKSRRYILNLDDAGKASSPSDDGPATKKLPRWKRRTPEQIEANKAAQKRFRSVNRVLSLLKRPAPLTLLQALSRLKRECLDWDDLFYCC